MKKNPTTQSLIKFNSMLLIKIIHCPFPSISSPLTVPFVSGILNHAVNSKYRLFFFLILHSYVPCAPSGASSKKTSSDPRMAVQQNSSPACPFLSQLSQKQSVAFFPNVSCSLSSPRKKTITLLIFFHFMAITFQPHSPFPGLHNQVGDSSTEICPQLPPLSLTLHSASLTLSPCCFIQIKQVLFDMVEMECDTRVMTSKSPHPFIVKFTRRCHLLWRQSRLVR